MIALRCGSAPIPPVLVDAARIVDCEGAPDKEDAARVRRELDADNRVVLCGTDAEFAALVTRFLRADALDVELAFVTDQASPATRAYHLPTGSAAARLAVSGTARELPLIRDDTGTALVGEATVTGPDGGPLIGEAYADDERLFGGSTPGLTIRPTIEAPGARASVAPRRGLLRRRRWVPARATQLGTEAGVVVRDGVAGRRPVKRASFYRHVDPWRLVTP